MEMSRSERNHYYDQSYGYGTLTTTL